MNNIPKVIEIYTESTPNPRTLKFVLNFMLLENALLECTSLDDCQFSPLAKELIEPGDISSVFISNNFLTLTKSETTDKDWFELGIDTKEFLKTYFKAGNIAITDDFEEKRVEQAKISAEKNSEIEVRIVELLDKYVKPAVESDGGNIAFNAFEGGVVSVILQGACSGCPSSTATLKDGIEALLQRMVPEVQEVVAING